MGKRLEFVLIKICERFPLGLTFKEKLGICLSPNVHCRSLNSNNGTNFCYKRTYTTVSYLAHS